MEAPGKSEETVSNYTPRNWGIETGMGALSGVIAGMLFGGMKEAALEKRCQLKKDAMEKRFERITRGSINGGVRLGLFAGAFYGLQNLLAEKRGVHDVFNYVCAGSATTAATGLTVRGSPLFQAINVAGASVSGAAFGFAIGWLEINVLEKVIGGNVDSYRRREAGTGVGAAKERLEENLNE